MPVFKSTEIVAKTENRPGVISKLMDAASRADVNIMAFFCREDSKGNVWIHMVPEEIGDAERAIKNAGFNDVRTHEVVLVRSSDYVGVGAKQAAILGKNKIKVIHAYATAGAEEYLTVYRVDENVVDHLVHLLDEF